jgi:predicted nucleic acid-binding protein
MIILDTNILSDVMQLKEPVTAWLDRQPRTSVWTTSVTIFEIRYGLAVMPSGKRRAGREAALGRLIEDKLEGRVLAFDEAAAAQAVALLARRHLAGIPRDLRDTMIAGIALAQRATLATRNVKHFGDLTVPVVDPWQQQ